VRDVLAMINDAAEAADVKIRAAVNNLGNGVKIADNSTIGPLPVSRIQGGAGLGGATSLTITDRAGRSVTIENLDEAETVQDLVDRMNAVLAEAGVGVEVTFKTAGDGIMLEDTTESEQQNFIVLGPAAGPLEIEEDVAGEIIRGGNILPDWEPEQLTVEGPAAEALGIADSVKGEELQSGNIDANTYRIAWW